MYLNREATGSAPAATSAEPGAAPAGGLARVRMALRRKTPEHLAVLALGLLVVVVHNVAYLLRQPFWTDEAWVAVTTRFPLSQLRETTSSTPIGWSLLLRLFTERGEQTGRLLPLAFAGVAVVIAYWLGRGIGWRRREISVAAGLLTAIAVLLVPAMLVRDDLKQYTADACLSLLVLVLTSRLERDWSRGGLAYLSVAVWGGMLFSDPVAFVGAAAFGALLVVQLCRRAWGHLAETAVTAACTAVLMLAVYKEFDARADYPGLKSYWSAFYLPAAKGLHADLEFVTSRFHAVGSLFRPRAGLVGVPAGCCRPGHDFPAGQASHRGRGCRFVARTARPLCAAPVPIPRRADLDLPFRDHRRGRRDRAGRDLFTPACRDSRACSPPRLPPSPWCSSSREPRRTCG